MQAQVHVKMLAQVQMKMQTLVQTHERSIDDGDG